MPCSVVIGYQRFRGPWYLYLQGEVAGMGKAFTVPKIMNMEAVRLIEVMFIKQMEN
jgi:hypothetical protein